MTRRREVRSLLNLCCDYIISCLFYLLLKKKKKKIYFCLKKEVKWVKWNQIKNKRGDERETRGSDRNKPRIILFYLRFLSL